MKPYETTMTSLISEAREGGQALARELRGELEQAFGTELSHVRVHTTAAGERAARNAGALAFAWNEHLFFSPGAWQPETAAGRRLIAHEIAHVLQQTLTRGPVSPTADLEAEAETAADAVAAGRRFEVRRRAASGCILKFEALDLLAEASTETPAPRKQDGEKAAPPIRLPGIQDNGWIFVPARGVPAEVLSGRSRWQDLARTVFFVLRTGEAAPMLRGVLFQPVRGVTEGLRKAAKGLAAGPRREALEHLLELRVRFLVENQARQLLSEADISPETLLIVGAQACGARVNSAAWLVTIGQSGRRIYRLEEAEARLSLGEFALSRERPGADRRMNEEGFRDLIEVWNERGRAATPYLERLRGDDFSRCLIVRENQSRWFPLLLEQSRRNGLHFIAGDGRKAWGSATTLGLAAFETQRRREPADATIAALEPVVPLDIPAPDAGWPEFTVEYPKSAAGPRPAAGLTGPPRGRPILAQPRPQGW